MRKLLSSALLHVAAASTADYVTREAFLPIYRVGSNTRVRAGRASEARLFTTGVYDASH